MTYYNEIPLEADMVASSTDLPPEAEVAGSSAKKLTGQPPNLCPLLRPIVRVRQCIKSSCTVIENTLCNILAAEPDIN